MCHCCKKSAIGSFFPHFPLHIAFYGTVWLQAIYFIIIDLMAIKYDETLINIAPLNTRSRTFFPYAAVNCVHIAVCI